MYITAIVLTGNSSRLLGKCLASLSFCHKIIVVDSLSTDNSVEIAKSFGAEVLFRSWTHIGEQFAFAFKQVREGYILVLDSDELCSKELEAEVLKAVAQSETDGYYLKRRSWYFDRFILHSGWRPDWLYRFFKVGSVRICMSGAHQSFEPCGTFAYLSADIIHYPYSSFYNHFEKLNDYAERGAKDLKGKGKAGSIISGCGHGLMRFIKLYFLKKGFLDGKAGFIIACHGAFYAFLKYVRVLDASWGKPYDQG